MKYSELIKIEPGTCLLVSSVPFAVHQVSDYKSRTAKWRNLVSETVNGEVVLEFSDGDIRQWTQVLDLLSMDPGMEEVQYRGHHFEVDESKVRAKTETRTATGVAYEVSVTSVYVDEEDEDVLLSIELKGVQIFVWYSDKMISPRNIKEA